MTRSRETLTDYEMIHRDFSIDVPEYFNFGFDIVDRWAKKDRNKLALMWVNQKGEEKKFSFPDLSNPQNRKQIFFLKFWINNRDQVLVLLASIPGMVDLYACTGLHLPGLFVEYLDNAEENRKTLVNGWYYTGNKVLQDADGYFWFVGKDDDVIKSSGYRIGPFEVEKRPY